MSAPLTLFQVRLPQNNEYTIESMTSFLSTLTQSVKKGFWENLTKSHSLLASLEIVLKDGQIYFYFVCPTSSSEFLKSQLLSQFNTALISVSPDYLQNLAYPIYISQLGYARADAYPLKSSRDFRDTDPLTSVLASLSRSSKTTDFFVYQILLSPPPKSWTNQLISTIQNGVLVDSVKNQRSAHPDKQVFEQKIQFPVILGQINLISNNRTLLSSLSSSFGVYTNPRGNLLLPKEPNLISSDALKSSILGRTIRRRLKKHVFNTEELSLLWHFPGKLTKVPNLAWGKTLYADPPENLPVAEGVGEDEKQNITFFAKTEFRNKETIFGIKDGEDRRRHTYIIGKSGTGKTTLIANMAIDDIRKGKGVAIIDPHGDLSQTILDYIPASRIQDTCYFNPADTDFIYPINVLEAHNDSQRELVASGVMSIFKKLYGNSWGPRLEHILRNTLLTLVYVEGSHLGHVVEILTDESFRKKTLSQLKNPTLLNFWKNEFERMDDKLRIEAISPILNKVGQFLSSSNIRNTVSQAKSKINIQQIMDDKKILIADLSSGKLGEDNSSLLGAMLISQIQLCAMNRVHIPQDQRQDFYLYVDEFQNFATEAFIKILSEARKFRLNLIIANQYMSQLDKTIQDAILGNVGSLLCYVVGSNDAHILAREFGEDFPPEDLVKIGRYQILSKLSIDSETKPPFYATALPPLACKNQGRDKLIANTRERWGQKTKLWVCLSRANLVSRGKLRNSYIILNLPRRQAGQTPTQTLLQ